MRSEMFHVLNVFTLCNYSSGKNIFNSLRFAWIAYCLIYIDSELSFIPEWTQCVPVKNPANNLMQIFAEHKSAEIAERISAAFYVIDRHCNFRGRWLNVLVVSSENVQYIEIDVLDIFHNVNVLMRIVVKLEHRQSWDLLCLLSFVYNMQQDIRNRLQF